MSGCACVTTFDGVVGSCDALAGKLRAAAQAFDGTAGYLGLVTIADPSANRVLAITFWSSEAAAMSLATARATLREGLATTAGATVTETIRAGAFTATGFPAAG
jgi:hypothetical protein